MVLAIFNQITPLLNTLQLNVTTCHSLATCIHADTHIIFLKKTSLQTINKYKVELSKLNFVIGIYPRSATAISSEKPKPVLSLLNALYTNLLAEETCEKLKKSAI